MAPIATKLCLAGFVAAKGALLHRGWNAHVAASGWTTGTYTTGYWDCCKPSCSWSGKGSVNRPIDSCDANTGTILQDVNVESVCNGGSAASCANNQPFIVNSGLSMGFTAAAVGGVSGLNGDENCGQCFELRFLNQKHDPTGDKWGGAHPDLVGKTMVVQVSNIGYDVSGDHSFDIQIPGAGQGIFTNGCTKQFSGYTSGDFDCDNNYGGCHTKDGCSRLPEALRQGCEWRYDWYRWLAEGGQTNNPYVSFRRVQCPSQLTNISGSVPLDDASYPIINVEDYASPSPTPTQSPAPTPMSEISTTATATTTLMTTTATATGRPTVQETTTTAMQSPSPMPTPAAADTGSSTDLAQVWDQCGGIQWQGPTQCVDGCVCEKQNDHYSQCLPSSSSSPTVSDHSQEGSTPSEAEITVTDGASSTSQAGAWGQCGGLDWEGPMQCIGGYTCERQNDHYSQCLPKTASLLGRKRAAVKVQRHLQK